MCSFREAPWVDDGLQEFGSDVFSRQPAPSQPPELCLEAFRARSAHWREEKTFAALSINLEGQGRNSRPLSRLLGAVPLAFLMMPQERRNGGKCC